jgi:hypothetical protein
VDFEIIKPTFAFARPKAFFARTSCGDNDEINYCTQVLKRAARNQTRLHLCVTAADNRISGFVALSAARHKAVVDTSCIVIDYLFTSSEYRGVAFEELGNKRISEYLIDYSIEIAHEMNSNVPFRYLALYPVHEKLSDLYRALDFKAFDNSGWLFFKISQ